MQTLSKLRRRKGQAPREGFVWAIWRYHSAWWVLIYRNTNQHWMNVKVAADCTPGKANYWLSWDYSRQSFGYLPDQKPFQKNYPELCELVRDTLSSMPMKPTPNSEPMLALDLDDDCEILQIDGSVTLRAMWPIESLRLSERARNVRTGAYPYIGNSANDLIGDAKCAIPYRDKKSTKNTPILGLPASDVRFLTPCTSHTGVRNHTPRSRQGSDIDDLL